MSRQLRIAAALVLLLLPASLQAGWLGVTVSQLVGGEDGERRESAVLVEQVQPESPAERAGLKPGDVILSVNGERTREPAELAAATRRAAAGTRLELVVRRDDRELPLQVTLGEAPDQAPDAEVQVIRPPVPPIVLDTRRKMRTTRAWLGVELLPLSDGLRSYFQTEEGVLVAAVAQDSPAQRAGLRAGDVVLSAGGEPIREPTDLLQQVRSRKAGHALDLVVLHDGRKQEKTAVLEAREAESLFFVMPDKGSSLGGYDVDVYRQAMVEYEQALKEHAEAMEKQAAPQTAEAKARAEELRRQVEELKRSMELLSGDESLRRLAESREALQTLMARRDSDSKTCERELERQEARLRRLEADLRQRDLRIRDLERRLRTLERESR